MKAMRFHHDGYIATVETQGRIDGVEIDGVFGLRKERSEDWSELYRIYSDPEIMRYVGGPITKPESEWVSQCTSDHADSHSLVELTTGRYAGNLRLRVRSVRLPIALLNRPRGRPRTIRGTVRGSARAATAGNPLQRPLKR
jgi:hypothetical protein